MVVLNTSSDKTFLGQDKVQKNQMETIAIKNRKKVPSNAIYSWDVSAAQDNSVIAWYTDVDNNNLYELYIGGDGGVKANPNSSNLFSYFNNVTIIDVTYLDTSEVTNMNQMFNMSNLASGGLAAAIKGSKLLEIKGLERFDTSEVTDMS